MKNGERFSVRLHLNSRFLLRPLHFPIAVVLPVLFRRPNPNQHHAVAGNGRFKLVFELAEVFLPPEVAHFLIALESEVGPVRRHAEALRHIR